MGVGECFGELALVDHGPRSADVIANQPSVLVKMLAVALKKPFAEAPALAARFLFALTRVIAAGAIFDQALRGLHPLRAHGFGGWVCRGVACLSCQIEFVMSERPRVRDANNALNSSGLGLFAAAF
jgi:hypothetical protein